MSDLRKAAEMALEYFEDAYGLEDTEVAIKEALRQALAMENFSEVNQEIEEALKQPKHEAEAKLKEKMIDQRNTVLERKLLISDAMKAFEKEATVLNILYTYSQLVKVLASDRPDDFQMVLATLRNERKAAK